MDTYKLPKKQQTKTVIYRRDTYVRALKSVAHGNESNFIAKKYTQIILPKNHFGETLRLDRKETQTPPFVYNLCSSME
jgi:hypothetical protein